MSDKPNAAPRTLTLEPLGVALVCSVLGWLIAPQETAAQILSMVIVTCVGLTLHQRANHSFLDSLLALAAASSVAGILLTRTATLTFRIFGIESWAASTAITALLVWVVPLAGAMMLLAVPERLKEDSLATALLNAVGLSLAAAALTFLAGSIACVGLGAYYSDYGMVVHSLKEIDLALVLPRAAISMLVASPIVFIGIRMDRDERSPIRAMLCAVLAAATIYLIHMP